MAVLKLYRYTVEGTGQFPVDMLRYDSCWPSTSKDVPLPTKGGRVELVGIQEPTLLRWRSFGWTVTSKVVVIKP
jgi:hypothetical protein